MRIWNGKKTRRQFTRSPMIYIRTAVMLWIRTASVLRRVSRRQMEAGSLESHVKSEERRSAICSLIEGVLICFLSVMRLCFGAGLLSEARRWAGLGWLGRCRADVQWPYRVRIELCC